MWNYRTSALLLVSILFSSGSFAQDHTPVDEGNAVRFTIKNLGISTSGSFKGLKGNIKFNASDLTTCFFNVRIDAASINTGIDARDNHLRKEDYFDVDKYPSISLVSTKIEISNTPGIFTFSGNINIKGVSRSISFPFTVVQKSDGYLFSGTFKLNRADFKIGGSSFTLSDNVEVTLAVSAKKN